MSFLIGSSVRQFQSKISGGLERSQAVITPGENYPGLKANRHFFLSLMGLLQGQKAAENSHHGIGADEAEQRDKSQSVEEIEMMYRISQPPHREWDWLWVRSKLLNKETAH